MITNKRNQLLLKNNKLTDLYKEAAKEFRTLVLKKLESQEKLNIGFSGGRSVIGFYMELSKLNLPWNKIQFFLVDERAVPIDSNESNYYLLYSTLLENLISEEKTSIQNAHSMIFNDDSEEEIIATTEYYNQELDNYGGLIDIAILSSGEEGHIGSVFPNHATVFNNEKNYIYTLDAPKFPHKRVTMSRNLIKATDTIFMFFINKAKEGAYTNFRDPTLTEYESPNKVALEAKNLFIVTNLE